MQAVEDEIDTSSQPGSVDRSAQVNPREAAEQTTRLYNVHKERLSAWDGWRIFSEK